MNDFSITHFEKKERMRLKYIFPLLLSLMPAVLIAQEVQMRGHLSGFSKGSLVRVLVYADQFSRLKNTVATTRTDSAGNFRLAFPDTVTTYAMLAINLKYVGFYLSPGGVYRFDISRDSISSSASSFGDRPMQVHFQAEDAGLNANIEAYDSLYSILIERHFRDIYQSHNRQVLKDFEAKTESLFGQVKSSYFRNYVHYSLASMVWGSRTRSLAEIMSLYFIGKPVLYQNIQYTNFFSDFFQSYFLSTVNKPVSKDKLLSVIPQRNLKKLDALFATAPSLDKDIRVRQLAEMIQLAKYFPDRDFDKQDIKALFTRMAKESPFPENRLVARDYLVKLNILQQGTPAPAFRLPGFTGKEFSLEDFKGKFVLLSFIRVGCPVCYGQIEELDNMAQKPDADFTNLTIVTGNITSKFMQQVHPTNRGWPFLLLGKDILLLEKYQVVTYPAYVLIDPRGRISMAPAPMPYENLQQQITSRIKAYKKKEQN